jgi:hypothetical protein
MAALNFGPTVSATSLVAVLLELNKLTKKINGITITHLTTLCAYVLLVIIITKTH